MTKKTLIDEIGGDVKDILLSEFNHYITKSVPSIEDSFLTFERGIEKKGKMLESCVLYVDIRDSVALTEKHHNQTMGRLYTALCKAVLKIARYHEGFIRNIIGDRIMVVFPQKDCFTNAVDCAISINYVCKHVISKEFKGVNFKCGIGVEYGKLRVIKVGLPRKGSERVDNKGLIWVGYPANIASRLTDIANKTIEEEYYEVTRNPINPKAFVGRYFRHYTPLKKPIDHSKEPLYLTEVETVIQTPREFADSFSQFNNGQLFTTGGKLIKFQKKVKITTYPEILITKTVFKGLNRENPKRSDIIKGLWKIQVGKVKNLKDDVYGGNIVWSL